MFYSCSPSELTDHGLLFCIGCSTRPLESAPVCIMCSLLRGLQHLSSSPKVARTREFVTPETALLCSPQTYFQTLLHCCTIRPSWGQSVAVVQCVAQCTHVLRCGRDWRAPSCGLVRTCKASGSDPEGD